MEDSSERWQEKRGVERVRKGLEWKVSGMKLMAGPRNVISKRLRI